MPSFTSYGQDTLAAAVLSAPTAGTVETWTVAHAPADPAGTSSLGATVLPYDIRVDGELCHVTAVNAGAKTITLTRGYADTFPDVHPQGSTIDRVVISPAELNGLGVGRTMFSNANYVADRTDKYLVQTGLMSAPHTVTLPLASLVASGYTLYVVDESGTVTPTNSLTVVPSGADTLSGGVRITAPRVVVQCVSNGVSQWTCSIPTSTSVGSIATQLGDPYLVLPSNWDAAWRAAKLDSVASPRWATLLGDSFTHGEASSDPNNLGYVGLLKARFIAAGYAWNGDYWCWGSQLVGAGLADPFWFDTGLGGTGWLAYAGLGQVPLFAGTAGSQGSPAVTFTTPYACTDMDIVYFNVAAGTWQYSVDGAAPVTVTSTAVNYSGRVQITGLANAIHIVSFFNQSAVQALAINGVCTYTNRTKGIGLGRVGIGSSQLIPSYGSTIKTDQAAAWQGKGVATTGFGFPTQPALGVIAYGINDCNVGLSVGAYKHTLERLVHAFRRGYRDTAGNPASVLLIAMCNPDGVNSDVTSPIGPNSKYWWMFVNAMVDVARAENCGLVNFHAKWGEFGAALGFQAVGAPHPTDAGHADMAATLAPLLV